jgi:thiamine transport system ATP-binding protein
MAGTEEPMWGDLVLEIRDISLSLGATTVLRNLSLDVGDGEVVAILGPSGSGKSTLLRVIAGLIAPDAGHILLDGAVIDDVPTHRRDIGLVFQDEQLFAHRSVNRNIEFGLRMRHWKQSDRAVRVREMLELVGLAGFGERRVTDLSGGEAKRVALVRTLAPFPKIVLLDEPLTGLDRPLHDQLAKELGRLLRVTGTSALLVTHDHEEAEVIADRVVSLTRPS